MKYEKKPAEERFCVQCGKRFMQPRARAYTCQPCVDYGARTLSSRFCSRCGKKFVPVKGEYYFCSEECRGEEPKANREKVRVKSAADVKPKKQKEKKETLTSIQQKAHKEGLSYGQYVAKYGL